MLESFQRFLQFAQVSPEDVQCLEGAALEKVEVYAQRRLWRLFVTLPHPLAPDVLERIVEQSRNGLLHSPLRTQLEWWFRPEYVDVPGWMESHRLFLVKELSRRGASSAWLEQARFHCLNHEVLLRVQQPLMLEMVRRRGLERLLAELLEQYTGRRLAVKAELMEDEELQRQLSEEKRKEEQALITQALAVQQERRPPAGANGSQEQQVFYGRPIAEEPMPISQVELEERCVVHGEVFKLESRPLRSGKVLFQFALTDYSDSILVKVFARDGEEAQLLEEVSPGQWLKVRGVVQEDLYQREWVLHASDIVPVAVPKREDHSEEKRVELHAHTSMSAMDGISSAKKLIHLASSFGHKAIAITDHGVVQAYPEAYEAGKQYGVKVIYGMEAYLIDDGVPIVYQPQSARLEEAEYVVFDTETTGLSAQYHEIIEIAAVRMKGGQVTDSFQTFVRPKGRISPEITRLTGITPEMVADAPGLEVVLGKFMEFSQGAVLVAHNARFDVGFLNANFRRLGWEELASPVVDTVELARFLYPQLRNHRLDTLCQHFQIPLTQHHRALNDAEATAHLMWQMVRDLVQRGIVDLQQLEVQPTHQDYKRVRPFHATILVQNETGLKNLYKLVSLSHLKYYYRVPRIPRSELEKYREGLLIGTACQQGELFETLLQKSVEEAEEVAAFYDFLEVQPPEQYRPLIDRGIVQSEENLRDIIRNIIQIGERQGKPVVATGDVHYAHPHEEIYRRILTHGKVSPDSLTPAYLRTTEEMLSAFSFLGDELARRIVVEEPRRLESSIEEIKPFPDALHTPIIQGSEDAIRRLSYEKAKKIYGDPLPELVEQRLERELNSIVGNGFAVIYYIAHKLVTKSLEDGYLVGSRGSVGSSFVATMTDITEVNPLPPHYVCTRCHYSRFFTDGSVGSGFDLPEANCPRCDTPMVRDGQDIPFETFMGFEGDKVPDIDLNFSGEYQPRAHKYTEELFGKDFVYRAGTISTVAEKTAFGLVKKYLEETGMVRRNTEIERLALGCTGIKRTTGQHPGGLMVIPQDREVYDFTPIQHPADDEGSGTITTHFDYHAISGRLLKLDILGHDDPTVIRMLQDLTGEDPKKIPVNDPRVLSLFRSPEALGVTPEMIRSNTGTLGIPEFGTRFVRQMLEDTRPQTFSDLVRISGLSHGTDVWLNNAQEIVRSKKAVLSEVIATRDDIMVYLIYKGIKPADAFRIMERVRKGKGLEEGDIELLQNHQVPDWYIESCQKIKYMFPKAHAVAYVMMALRIAWFKVYYPLQYYATYFSVRADDVELHTVLKGTEAIISRMEEIEASGAQATQKEKNLLTVLEVALEMYQRGYRILPIDLYQSDATRFLVRGEALLAPFSALGGIGTNAARNIVKAREEGPFLSVEDFQVRTKVSRTVVEVLAEMGCFAEMPDTNQLSLF